jgi:hypothetical protein
VPESAQESVPESAQESVQESVPESVPESAPESVAGAQADKPAVRSKFSFDQLLCSAFSVGSSAALKPIAAGPLIT